MSKFSVLAHFTSTLLRCFQLPKVCMFVAFALDLVHFTQQMFTILHFSLQRKEIF